MKSTPVSLLLLALGVAAAQSAIDFTPVPTERVLEGMKFPGLTFQENGRPVSYEQPRGWTYSGGGPAIRFAPLDAPLAQAGIDQTPLAQPLDLTEETLKALHAKALAAVPTNSINVKLESEKVNPFLVNAHSTYEAVVSFELYGQAFAMGVVYVNLPDTQLRFRATARKADFEKVYGEFRGSVFSLQWHQVQRH